MARKKDMFVNRELSWLEFNQRVLDEALNVTLPLLERLNFLAITAANLDEFFMVRVGGLQLVAESGLTRRDPCGLTARQQLHAIAHRVQRMADEQYACYSEALEPGLVDAGITRVRPAELTMAQRRHVQQVFEETIYPVITPMRVDGLQTFPLLRNGALHLAVRLKPGSAERRHPRFAVIPLPPLMRRFMTLPSERGYAYMLVEDVVRIFVERFFPGEAVMEVAPFRITRNADLEAREDFTDDFRAEMQAVLDRRKQGDCVRLEILSGCSKRLLAFFQKVLGVDDSQTFQVPGPINLAFLSDLVAIEGFDSLRYKPWPPQPSPKIEPGGLLFDQLARRDLLLLHPYDSFEPVLRFIKEAASDPHVLAIKQTLYRTSSDSPVIAALQAAAEKGKAVTVVVELKARFDEASNIERARELEKAGAQVIYGVKGLKTHSKICLVVRKEPRGLMRYLHLGTGNYNEKTARIYSDISLFTSHPDFGADASAFFNALCGYSEPGAFLKLAVAPFNLRDTLLALINAETERCRQGQKALIMAKINSLVDPDIIKALCLASQAGVKVRLNVRGICCLKPGIKGVSEHITIVSIVDRFLEHARIFHFHAGGEKKLYISSADWMPRNLDRRVELMTPVIDPACRAEAIAILETYFKDNVKARRLLADGGYECLAPPKGKKAFRSQEVLYRRACKAIGETRQTRPTALEPLRPTEDDRS